MNQQKTITTTNRRLENYLYVLGINPIRMYKSWDMMTVWEYEDTPQLRELTAEFLMYQSRRKALKEGASR